MCFMTIISITHKMHTTLNLSPILITNDHQENIIKRFFKYRAF